MRNLAEQGMNMLQLLGNAMYARPDLDQTEARRYYRRLLQTICRSGEDELAPEVYVTTEDGKLLAEAGRFAIRMNILRPDPDQLERMICINEMKDWAATIIMTAAGAQQLYELQTNVN